MVIHFEVQTDDVERAKNFYEKIFNWKIQKMGSGDDPIDIDYWGLHAGEEDTPGINGGLYKRTPGNKRYAFGCTIEVADIDKAVEILKNMAALFAEKKIKFLEWVGLSLQQIPKEIFFGIL